MKVAPAPPEVVDPDSSVLVTTVDPSESSESSASSEVDEPPEPDDPSRHLHLSPEHVMGTPWGHVILDPSADVAVLAPSAEVLTGSDPSSSVESSSLDPLVEVPSSSEHVPSAHATEDPSSQLQT